MIALRTIDFRGSLQSATTTILFTTSQLTCIVSTIMIADCPNCSLHWQRVPSLRLASVLERTRGFHVCSHGRPSIPSPMRPPNVRGHERCSRPQLPPCPAWYPPPLISETRGTQAGPFIFTCHAFHTCRNDKILATHEVSTLPHRRVGAVPLELWQNR